MSIRSMQARQLHMHACMKTLHGALSRMPVHGGSVQARQLQAQPVGRRLAHARAAQDQDLQVLRGNRVSVPHCQR